MTSLPRVLRAAAVIEDHPTLTSPETHKPRSHSRVLRRPAIGGLDAITQTAVQTLVDPVEEAFQRGLEQGREAARQQVMSATSALQSALTEGRSQLRNEFTEQRDEFVAMAVEMASMVVGHEHHDGGKALTDRLEDALCILDDDDLEISMNPTDLVIGAELETQGVRLVADPTLLPGEARITGTWAEADLTRATAQRLLREQMS